MEPPAEFLFNVFTRHPAPTEINSIVTRLESTGSIKGSQILREKRSLVMSKMLYVYILLRGTRELYYSISSSIFSLVIYFVCVTLGSRRRDLRFCGVAAAVKIIRGGDYGNLCNKSKQDINRETFGYRYLLFFLLYVHLFFIDTV